MSAIGQNDRRIQYTTAGGESSFAYDFQIDDADHVAVYRDGVLQTRGTHYSVNGVGNSGGGDIVPDGSLTIASGETWTISGDTPEDRSNDYSGFARVPPQTIDDDLDRMIFMMQQLRRDSNRAIRIDIEEATDEETLRLPGSSDRADKNLGFDENGKVTVRAGSGSITLGSAPSSVSQNSTLGRLASRDDIAAAQALDPGEFLLVYVRGRTSDADGFEGWFIWDDTDRSSATGDGSAPADEVTTGEGDGGIIITPSSDKTGASGSLFRLDAEIVNAGWYADTSAADNSSALAAMYASSPGAVRFDEFFPVTGNFKRPLIPHFGEGGVTIGGTDIPLNTERTRVPVTVYVNPTGDDDNNHGLSSGNPFATIQRAYDSLPASIDHQQTIELADATHTGNYLDPGVESNFRLPRAAVLFGRGKSLSPRSQSNAGDMSAAVVIKSAGGNKANCIIETDATYTYGIYNAHGQIGLQELTIQAGATADTLLASHRSSAYVHCFDVDVKDNSQTVSVMLLAEAGGMIEYTGVDWDIDGGTTGISCIGRGSTVNLAGNGEVKNNTVSITGKNGQVILSKSAGSTSTWFSSSTNGISGRNMDIDMLGGGTSDRIQIDVPVVTENLRLHTTFVDFLTNAPLRPENAMVHFDDTNFQSQFTLIGGLLRLKNVDTFVSPSSANDSSTPIRNEGGVVTYEGASNNIVGASSGHPTYPITLFSASGNGETYTPSKDVNVYEMDGNGGTRTGGTLGVAADDFLGHEIMLFSANSGIEITASATCDVAASFSIGGSAGQYAAARFVLSDDGKWTGGPIGDARS